MNSIEHTTDEQSRHSSDIPVSRKSVVILGSTGSIGVQTLDVISHHSEQFTVEALASGGSHLDKLIQQVLQYRPKYVVIAREDRLHDLQDLLTLHHLTDVQLFAGQQRVEEIAGLGADIVVNGITGSVGLRSSISALQAGSQLALANKESVVAGGHLLFSSCVRKHQINPVDSEHSAIWQSLRAGKFSEIDHLVLTASGGPFRKIPISQFSSITPEQALAHPTWNMGPVVTINSSTLMNKGLELIEASRLFDVAADHITVVVHPQSRVHSMVTFCDGSTICQVSPPDMHIPLALGLSAPQRLENVAPCCDWSTPSQWTFEPLDNEKFPAVKFARQALEEGEWATCALNAANEQAVSAFLKHALCYLDIVSIVKQTLEQLPSSFHKKHLSSVEEMEEIEHLTRQKADLLINMVK